MTEVQADSASDGGGAMGFMDMFGEPPAPVEAEDDDGAHKKRGGRGGLFRKGSRDPDGRKGSRDDVRRKGSKDASRRKGSKDSSGSSSRKGSKDSSGGGGGAGGAAGGGGGGGRRGSKDRGSRDGEGKGKKRLFGRGKRKASAEPGPSESVNQALSAAAQSQRDAEERAKQLEEEAMMMEMLMCPPPVEAEGVKEDPAAKKKTAFSKLAPQDSDALSQERTKERPYTLDEVLGDQDLLTAFRSFLTKTLQVENLAMYLEILQLEMSDPMVRGDRGRQIFDMYVDPNSKHVVNITSAARKEIVEHVEAGGECPPEIFAEPKKEMERLMISYSLPLFFKSPEFQEVNEAEEARKQAAAEAAAAEEQAAKDEEEAMQALISPPPTKSEAGTDSGDQKKDTKKTDGDDDDAGDGGDADEGGDDKASDDADPKKDKSSDKSDDTAKGDADGAAASPSNDKAPAGGAANAKPKSKGNKKPGEAPDPEMIPAKPSKEVEARFDALNEAGMRELVKDRRHRLRVVKVAFSGHDLCVWLVRNDHVESYDEAEALGKEFVEQGLMHHTLRAHHFADSSSTFYRFKHDEDVLTVIHLRKMVKKGRMADSEYTSTIKSLNLTQVDADTPEEA